MMKARGEEEVFAVPAYYPRQSRLKQKRVVATKVSNNLGKGDELTHLFMPENLDLTIGAFNLFADYLDRVSFILKFRVGL